MKFFALLFYALFPFAQVLAENSVPTYSLPPEIKVEGSVVSYRGGLNPAGTLAVLEVIRQGRYKTLRIESRGGEIFSAMEFGTGIFEYGMDVVVTKLCISSCANYIFPAGRHKTIEAGALVLWHGDARQYDFMETLRRLETQEAKLGVEKMTEPDQKLLAYERKSMAAQDAFYASIGIDGHIARIGHELDRPAQLWTMPKREMETFNILNVSAPDGYGTKEYCKTWSKEYTFSGRVSCLTLHDLAMQD